MKWSAIILAAIVTVSMAFGIPAASGRVFASQHDGMEAMPCGQGDCQPMAAACAAHCLSTALHVESIPFALSTVLLLLAFLPILLSLVPAAPVLRLVPVSTGPPGRFERRLLTIMKRE